jgi:hypothetical protein
VSNSSKHYSECKQGHTKLSPLLERKAVYLGSMLPYELSSESIKLLLNVSISDSTVFRLTDRAGDISQENIAANESWNKAAMESLNQDDRVYAQADGCMIHIREEGWKEVKLGRIFDSEAILESGGNQYISQSTYLGTLGDSKTFAQEMQKVLPQNIDMRCDLVFNSDGAVWIRQLINEIYPTATSILDISHLVDHMSKFIEANYGSEQKAKRLMNWKQIVLEQGGQTLCEAINKTRTRSKKALQEKQKFMKYLHNNIERMNYPEYISKNYYIGSGAIESAHRHVIQARMKKSGQVWSRKGAEKMIALRIVLKNGLFDQLFKKSA